MIYPKVNTRFAGWEGWYQLREMRTQRTGENRKGGSGASGKIWIEAEKGSPEAEAGTETRAPAPGQAQKG